MKKNYTVDDFIKNDNLRVEFQQKCKERDSLNCHNVLSALDIINQAKKGVIEKQLLLGEAYLSDRNFKEAIHWLTKAADKDNAQAINKLGQIYYLTGSKKNLTKDDEEMFSYLEKKLSEYKKKDSVLKYYLRKLSEGDTEALISLGIMYKSGRGVEKNHDTAISYFKRYTETKGVKNPGWGEYYLAYMYLEGNGFRKSEMNAMALFDSSCNMGFELSCYKLGDLYFYGGNEFNPNYKKATELLDVYSVGKHVDTRAIEYANNLFKMYGEGGFGINKNSQRIEQLKEILCSDFRYLLDSCEE
ncbi:TPA: sel1 repeat family protein [Escherichia coli]|nr:sel1 repeat family protein [Escherichia coli]